MQQYRYAMKVALRVLVAMTHKHAADPADITALRDLAPVQPRDIDLDELACEVIQNALKQRAMLRIALGRA